MTRKYAPKPRNHLTDEHLKKALTKTNGRLSDAAILLGVSKSTMTVRLKKSVELQEHVHQIIESRIDAAEQALDTEIRKGNITAILFFLKTIGRRRGYIEHAPLEEIDSTRMKMLKDFFSTISKGTKMTSPTIDSIPEDLPSSPVQASKKESNFP